MFPAILAAFLGGLILNVMPCVLPIVSLKLLAVVDQRDGAKARLEGWVYLAGVLVTMLALAGLLVALRAGGHAAGWGFQLQSPVVAGALVLVMLAAALNLAGVFEFGMAAQRLGAVGQDRRGLSGSFVTGALAVLVATPCSGPFMAGATGYALLQTPAVTLSVFAALAVGFAFPFVLLSSVPSLARWLPRPGAWMETVRRVLAFPMFGAAAWLTWVLGRQAGADAMGLMLAAAVVLALSAWLYGVAQRRQMMGRGHWAGHIAALVALLLAVAPLTRLPGTSGADGAESAAASTLAAGSDAVDADATGTAEHPMEWTPAALQAQLGKGRPILVDFTAAWCITCQVNAKTTLDTDAVKQAIARTNTVYMVGDSTNYNPDIDDELVAHGNGGLPLYLVYPAGGGEPKVLPQILSPALVIEALEQAQSGTAATGRD